MTKTTTAEAVEVSEMAKLTLVGQTEKLVAAQKQLDGVKAQASEAIHGLIALVKGMYMFADNLDGMNSNGKPVADIVADLYAATSAKEIIDALSPATPTNDASGEGEA